MDCNDEIKTLIAQRMEKGRKEYGHGLVQNSGYDWLQEALEEALDLSIYLSAKIIELKNLPRRPISNFWVISPVFTSMASVVLFAIVSYSVLVLPSIKLI